MLNTFLAVADDGRKITAGSEEKKKMITGSSKILTARTVNGD